MKTFTAALIQMCGTPDCKAGLRELEKSVRDAVSKGARLVCGPELFYFDGDMQRVSRHAVTIPGPVTEQLSALARKYGVYLCPGTLPERREGGAPYNTLLFFSPDGALVGRYRKRHLFRVDIPGELRHHERDYFSAGDDAAPVFETELGRLGVSICYDLRFPEQFLGLALRGAEIIIAPSAFTTPTGEAHWHVLCRARAAETGCFILAPDRTGICGADIERYGHSLVVDPWGTILAEAGKVEEVISAELRAESLADARGRLRSIEHRARGDSVPDP